MKSVSEKTANLWLFFSYSLGLTTYFDDTIALLKYLEQSIENLVGTINNTHLLQIKPLKL